MQNKSFEVESIGIISYCVLRKRCHKLKSEFSKKKKKIREIINLLSQLCFKTRHFIVPTV